MSATSDTARLIDRLSELASKFRSACAEDRREIVNLYNKSLGVLLDAGWDDFLDPMDELPDQDMDARYFDRAMSLAKPPPELLVPQLGHCDPVLMTIRQVSGQTIVGAVERVYATRFSKVGYPKTMSFVGSMGSWGNVTLQQGERALVFVCYQEPRFYQCHWHGHLSVETINGAPHAIANWDLLSAARWGPDALYEAAFLVDPRSPMKVAMPYALLEQHLLRALY